MAGSRMIRRQFLKGAAKLTLLTPLVAACAQAPPTPPTPQVIEKIVTQVVTQIVTPTPSPQTIELVWNQYTNWSGKLGNEPDGKPDDYLQWQADQFHALNPNVTIKWDNSVDPRKIDGSIAVGKPINVASFNGQDISRYGLLGALSPIDAYVGANVADYLPNPYQEMELAGKHYGYPYRLSAGGGLLVNTDMFKARGVEKVAAAGADSKNPHAYTWTNDEFLAAAKAATFAKSGSGAVDTYGIVLSPEYTHLLNQFLLSYGARLWSDDLSKITLNNDVGVAALQWLADLELSQKVAAPGTAGRGVNDMSTYFQNSQAASFPVEIGYQWKLLQTQAKNGKWANAFGFWGALPPNQPGQTPLIQTNIFGQVVLKQKDPQVEVWGHKFAQFLADKDHSLLFVNNGFPPVRKSLLDAAKADPVLAVVADMGSTNFYTFGRLARASGPDSEMYQQVFSGKMKPKDAIAAYLTRGQTALDEAFKLIEEGKKRGNF